MNVFRILDDYLLNVFGFSYYPITFFAATGSEYANYATYWSDGKVGWIDLLGFFFFGLKQENWKGSE